MIETNMKSISSLLSENGHRVTPERRCVVEAVLAADGLFSIGDIVKLAQGIGRATVFRAMKSLVDLDLGVSRESRGREPALPPAYGAQASSPPRLHKLRECGRLPGLQPECRVRERRRADELPDSWAPAGAVRALSCLPRFRRC